MSYYTLKTGAPPSTSFDLTRISGMNEALHYIRENYRGPEGQALTFARGPNFIDSVFTLGNESVKGRVLVSRACKIVRPDLVATLTLSGSGMGDVIELLRQFHDLVQVGESYKTHPLFARNPLWQWTDAPKGQPSSNLPRPKNPPKTPEKKTLAPPEETPSLTQPKVKKIIATPQETIDTLVHVIDTYLQVSVIVKKQPVRKADPKRFPTIYSSQSLATPFGPTSRQVIEDSINTYFGNQLSETMDIQALIEKFYRDAKQSSNAS